MKQFLSMLVVAGLLAYGILLLAERDRLGVSPTTLVPGDAVAVIEWEDAAGSLRRFMASQLGDYVFGPDFAGVLQGLEVKPEHVQGFRKTRSLLRRLDQDPLFKWLMGGRVAVALLPTDLKRTSDAPLNLVLVANPPATLSAVGRLAELLQLQRSRLRTVYKGVKVHALKVSPEIEVYVSWFRGMLILGLHEAAVRGSIDLAFERYLADETGLQQSPEMVKIHARTSPGNDLLCMARLPELMQEIGVSLPGETLARFQTLALLHAADGDTDQLAVIGLLAERSAEGGFSTRKPAEPVIHARLQALPPNILLYFWSNWLSLDTLWQEAASSKQATMATAAFLTALRIEEYTGMSLVEFFKLFGHDFGFMADRVLTNGFFPVPRLCLLLEVRDSQGVEDLLNRLLEALPVTREEVNGTVIHSLQMAEGLLQPSYALTGNSLLIADNREQIMELLEKKGPLLGEDALYKSVDAGFSEPVNLVSFVRTDEIGDGLKELARWTVSLLDVRKDADAAKNRLFLEKVALPLLDSFKQFKANGVQGKLENGTLVLRVNLAS